LPQVDSAGGSGFADLNANWLDWVFDKWNDAVVHLIWIMHAFLASLTAGLLFIHAAFGCCWHHAHRCQKHGDAIAVAGPTDCCQHHEKGDSNQQERPCDCQLQCGGTCVYLLPERVSIDAPQLVAAFDFAAIMPPMPSAQPLSPSRGELGYSPHGAPRPVRLHLLHQLLLN
jgi:hypothetical protein